MAGHLIVSRISGLVSTKIHPPSGRQLEFSAGLKNSLMNMGRAATIVRREPQTELTTSSAIPTKSCTANDSSPICEKPVSSSASTLPIVLGIVIPLVVALIVLLVLHRRHVRKLRSEDANDRHKSLDFGLGDVPSPGKGRGKQGKEGKAIPEMSFADTEKGLGRTRGLSMDMDVNNPYILPPELQRSQGSLRSLSRTMNSGDDKYQPATTFLPNDRESSREGSSSRVADDSSSFTASTRQLFREKESEPNQSLLRNAQRMSRSVPLAHRLSTNSVDSTPVHQDPDQSGIFDKKNSSALPSTENLAPFSSGQTSDAYRTEMSKDDPSDGLRKSNHYLRAFIRSGGQPAVEGHPNEEKKGAASLSFQDKSTGEAHVTATTTLPALSTDVEPLSFEFPNFNHSDSTIKTDAASSVAQVDEVLLPNSREERGSEPYAQDFDYDVRRLTMGIRPLPPDDPTEDPEQRAIRIRSFYKEYFDDAKSGPVYTQQDYQSCPEGFGYDHRVYDGFNPHTQPLARRAMTPPPRGAPSLQGPGRGRILASASGGHFLLPSPRAFSSASGRGPLRKKLPPPAPLQILPTPHLLKDDSIIPIDFAPPSSFRERRAGTPDSAKGGLRPYSPTLAAVLPLASSFDDLSIMPSPHALRKSGAFTALDFAPPPRFRSGTDAKSDSGSIVSSRSGISTAQLHSIRAGAYRVSRIPQELGGTKEELLSTLRPQWDQRK